jgi:hypothetical protein
LMSDVWLTVLLITDLISFLFVGFLLFRLRDLERYVKRVELEAAKDLAEFSDMIGEDIERIEKRNSGHSS